jgi:excisionase family DNA binding protein
MLIDSSGSERTEVSDRPHPDDRVLLRVEEAATRLGIARTSMFRLVGSGEVESVLVGRLRRIPSECLDEYVSRLRCGEKGAQS